MRNVLDSLSNSWTSVVTHKLRSILTILGIVIGVAAVIVLMSVGRGTESQILESISSLGSNMITISSGSTSSGGVRGGFGSASTITLEDAEAIEAEIANIDGVAPTSSSGSQVIAGSENMMVQITGITPSYLTIYNVAIASGDEITDYEYDRYQKVAMIGATVAETLFPDTEDPVGEKIRIGSNIFTIIALLESKGESMSSTDQTILVPLSTLQGMMSRSVTTTGEHTVSSIIVHVTDEDYIDSVKADITTLLEDRHQIIVGEDDDFSLTSTDEITETITSSMQSLTLLLGAIAGISLLVGGIGVMNIMLVSVMERRREIGVRKALGAKESDIWGQFLLDSAVLTFAGGLIGIGVGWFGSKLVGYFADMTTLVTMDIVVLAASVSIAIGLFFGFYPAWQGSKLDPIQALRSE